MKKAEYYIDVLVSLGVSPEDSTVVSGFWRSGTTWLQQSVAKLLNAKSVLEPLYPALEPYREAVLSRSKWTRDQRVSEIPFMPYSRNLKRDDALCEYLRRSLVSSLPGVHVRTARYDAERNENIRSVIDKVTHRGQRALRTKVVVKFTRAHLLLQQLRSHFGGTILHIRRDPRAVIASILRTHWTWPSDFSLVAHLLQIDDGRRDFFSDQAGHLREIDAMGVPARLAAYWACVEQHVQRLEQEGTVNPVRYERLLEERESYLKQLIPGVPQGSGGMLYGDSASTQEERRESSIGKRLHGWKSELSSEELDEINYVLDVFGCSTNVRGENFK